MSNKYYFTYGTEGYPYYGGWTVVYADSESQAVSLFRSVHPDKEEHALNCAAIYSEETFPIDMLKNGNFGNYAHEAIQIIVTSCAPAINAYVVADMNTDECFEYPQLSVDEFIEKYCRNCGTQRCEGIDTEWFDGCPKRFELYGYSENNI